MKLRSPELERRLREAARRELRQSPSMWRDYRRRVWQTRRRTVLPLLVLLALPPGVILAPIAFSMLLSIGLVYPHGDDWTHIADGVFAIYAIAIVAALMMIAGDHNRAYVGGASSSMLTMFSSIRSLRVCAHLPIHDRNLHPLVWLDAMTITVMAVLWLGFPYVLLAGRLGQDMSGWVTTCGLVLLKLLTVFACVVFACAYSPTRARTRRLVYFIGLYGLFGSFFVGVATPGIGTPVAGIAKGLLWMTPFGWVSSAYLYGHVLDVKAAWLFLIPAVAFVGCSLPLVLEWLRSDFAIREYSITPSGWYGVIERGFRVPRELPQPLSSVRPRDRKPHEPKLLDATTATRSVEAAEFLNEPPWRPYQILERFRDRLLSPRERLILRFWSGTYNLLTVQWLLSLAAVAVGVARAVLFPDAPAIAEGNVLWDWPFFILFIRYVIRDDTGGVEAWMSSRKLVMWPIDFREAFRASWKQELLRTLFAALLFVVYGLVIAPLAGVPAWQGVLHSLLPVLLILGLQPLLDCFKLSASTNDMRRIGYWVFWGCAAYVLLLLVLFLTRVPDLPLRYATLASVWVVSCTTCWCYTRAYRLGKVDLARASAFRPAL